IKSNLKKDSGAPKGRPGRRPGRPAASAAPAAAAPAARSASRNGDSLSADNLLQAKKLVDQVGGVDNVRSLLAILEKLS
ncbi:MAG: hypothetical protein KDA59_08640, partial [Planctomycetales bacterium]|nr:hypothetical protein [Planctomycetales bacterium]